jgi:hypothetical protein
MIEMRRKQLSFGDGLIADEISDLQESWMPHVDAVLADEEIVAIAYEAMAKRCPKSRSRGRRGSPAEMAMRLLVLKHIRNWSDGRRGYAPILDAHPLRPSWLITANLGPQTGYCAGAPTCSRR